jgi:hypothetical protein
MLGINIDLWALHPGHGGAIADSTNFYVAEDGVTQYVAEDGTTNYVQES